MRKDGELGAAQQRTPPAARSLPNLFLCAACLSPVASSFWSTSVSPAAGTSSSFTTSPERSCHTCSSYFPAGTFAMLHRPSAEACTWCGVATTTTYAVIFSWMLQYTGYAPGFLNCAALLLPLPYKPRSNAAPAAVEKTLWLNGS